jgi:hypothetical protein
MINFLFHNVQNKALIILVLFSANSLLSFSQVSRNDTVNTRIFQDDKVDLLVCKHIQLNRLNNGLDGFRIQIFFDSGNNSKTNAKAIYDAFTLKYPMVRAYLTFKAPNYKVRVGDFRTKLDAQRFLNEIITDYPSAWIIADQINLPQVEP